MERIPQRDREILRELALKMREVAALPIQDERRRLWKALNGLKPERPMVLIDQICWNEMNVDDELTLQCENSLCQRYETHMRRLLYTHRHLPVDQVVEPYLPVPKLMTGYRAGFADWEGHFDFGIGIDQETRVSDVTNNIVGHAYKCQIFSEADIDKIKTPEIRYQEPETLRQLERVQELFGDAAEVRLEGCYPGFWFFDAIVHWCGVNETLYNLIGEPELMHALCERLLHAYLTGLDQLEEQGLLGDRQTLVHCTGAYSDELEGSPAPVGSAKRLWTFNLSQIFCSISPAMHAAYEAHYSKAWYARFGLGYYGCCEPLHDRIDMLRQIPNIRKVSISPFADVEKGAEALGSRYVMSRKPNPNRFAASGFEEAAVYREAKDLMRICRNTGTPLEIIQKDVSTLMYKPERLWQWAEATMRAVLE